MNKLIEGCTFCGHPLKLFEIFGEVRYGLGSLLRINCKQCKKGTFVPSGKRSLRLRAIDVNTKLAFGVYENSIISIIFIM